MENMLKMFKFLVVLVAIAGAQVVNVQGKLPPCCKYGGEICDPPWLKNNIF
jgi:hypothetical protein